MYLYDSTLYKPTTEGWLGFEMSRTPPPLDHHLSTLEEALASLLGQVTYVSIIYTGLLYIQARAYPTPNPNPSPDPDPDPDPSPTLSPIALALTPTLTLGQGNVPTYRGPEMFDDDSPQAKLTLILTRARTRART